MGRIILITGTFNVYDRHGVVVRKEFMVSHGIDEFGRNVILPTEHPVRLGGVFDKELGEWVLEDDR